VVLLENDLDIHAATLDPLNNDIAGQTEMANEKVNQSSQSKTNETLEKKKKKKKFALPGTIVAAPLPIVSPAIGAGIIPAVGYIFPFGKDDKISPPSTVGAAGLITNNGSSGFALGGQLFMKENKYEISSLFLHGNVDYNLYGVGIAASNSTVGKNQVLAYNLFVCSTGGSPPFYGNCIYGTNNELRGYEAGRYLDRYMIATQVEYWVSLPRSWALQYSAVSAKSFQVARRFSESITFSPASVEDQGSS
jgi:hypothetical protein